MSEYQPQTVKIDKHTHQAHVMIGNRAYSIHDKRRMALYLLNNILGGPGMSARLNLALRERRGLVYTVESSMVSYSLTGIWVFTLAVTQMIWTNVCALYVQNLTISSTFH